MLDIMSSMDQVIVKRLPVDEIIVQEVNDVGIPCDCVGDVFNESDPDCRACNGTGIMRAELPPELIRKTSGEKKVWVTNAKIIIDDTAVIYDEEEEQVDSNIHGFFGPTEDIQTGDYVIPVGGKITYIVRGVDRVRSLENILLQDCALEVA